ncbi:hypothetical protein [Paenibacillus spongiae]|uniref:Spore protein n=1 Tax=Paenibacillus spongiae TaxID=2909671 RepID=A0ABY5S962_9BACL|nr:hypothetical protein [Paenibacillus spongiae]UVI28843.1 hypothetical protein L1F29_25890 [Paenibacillus spongiae]
MMMEDNRNAGRSKSVSRPDASADRNGGRKPVAPESAAFDKKLDGPNRPST